MKFEMHPKERLLAFTTSFSVLQSYYLDRMKHFVLKPLAIVIMFLITNLSCAQTSVENPELPYYQIPEYPHEYNACTAIARVVDGLGFRYYWATEGLRHEDLQFKPSEHGRTTDETLDHILGLVSVVLNAVKEVPNVRPAPTPRPTEFSEKRRLTLLRLKEASDILRVSPPEKMKDFELVFQRGETTSEYPFWNLLNGPLADALWHVGQVVSHRRTSGNPFNSKASVFQGKLRGE